MAAKEAGTQRLSGNLNLLHYGDDRVCASRPRIYKLKAFRIKNSGTSNQALESRKRAEAPDAEIRRWQAITSAPAPKRALKCRCHIDTQAEGENIDHHSSQFAMCKLITHSDQEWHRGFFDRRGVSSGGTAPKNTVQHR